jgi:hypothetical protein
MRIVVLQNHEHGNFCALRKLRHAKAPVSIQPSLLSGPFSETSPVIYRGAIEFSGPAPGIEHPVDSNIRAGSTSPDEGE